jgi:hypothetical protein
MRVLLVHVSIMRELFDVALKEQATLWHQTHLISAHLVQNSASPEEASFQLCLFPSGQYI